MKHSDVPEALRKMGLKKAAACMEATLPDPEAEYRNVLAQVEKIIGKSEGIPKAVLAKSDFQFSLPKGLAKQVGPDVTVILEELATKEYEGVVGTLADSFHNELSKLLKMFLTKVRDEFGNQGVLQIKAVLPEVFSAVAQSFFDQSEQAVIDGIDSIFEVPDDDAQEETKGKSPKEKKASFQPRTLTVSEMTELAKHVDKKGNKELAEAIRAAAKEVS